MLIGSDDKGIYYICDVERRHLSADDAKTTLRSTAVGDRQGVAIHLPQDPGQAGKPVYNRAMILMADGSLKQLADINLGDCVIGKNGKPHRVSEVHEQGDLPCLRIKTETGREVIAAPDHPFLTPEGRINPNELTGGATLALICRPETTGQSGRSAEEFRLAGYFIGDGAVGRAGKAGVAGSRHAEFVCHDDVQLADFKFCVASLGGEVVRRQRDGQFGTKGLQQWLRDTGLNGSTAYTKRVPAWVFSAAADKIAELIGAYFVCDGTVSRQGDEVVFYSVSKGLLEDVQRLLLRFGISSTLKTKNGKYLETRHTSYLLRLRQQDDAVARFVRRIPMHHARKSERLAAIASNSRFRRFDERQRQNGQRFME